MDTNEKLDEIMKLLKGIDENLKEVLQIIKSGKLVNEEKLDLSKYLAIPNHLKRTLTVLIEHGRLTAEQVAKLTGNSRSRESANLNKLLKKNMIKSERGKKELNENTKMIYFFKD